MTGLCQNYDRILDEINRIQNLWWYNMTITEILIVMLWKNNNIKTVVVCCNSSSLLYTTCRSAVAWNKRVPANEFLARTVSNEKHVENKVRNFQMRPEMRGQLGWGICLSTPDDKWSDGQTTRRQRHSNKGFHLVLTANKNPSIFYLFHNILYTTIRERGWRLFNIQDLSLQQEHTMEF